MGENTQWTIEKHGKLTIYKMRFRSLSDVERYLSSDPPVNHTVFYMQKSIEASKAFAGESLDRAIRYCLGGYENNFATFMQIKKELDQYNLRANHNRKTVHSVVGSRPNVPAFIAGAPKTMCRLEPAEKKKFIDLYMDLTYDNRTTEAQIISRGILTLNLISLLEEQGIYVDFKAFQCCYVDDEAFYVEIDLKRPEERINVQKCYYPMCGKEFLRRVLVRIMESVPFRRNWYLSYGLVMNEAQKRSLLNIPDDKIMILSPRDMGIEGDNIYEDAEAFLSRIHLKEKFRFPSYRRTDQG